MNYEKLNQSLKEMQDVLGEAPKEGAPTKEDILKYAQDVLPIVEKALGVKFGKPVFKKSSGFLKAVYKGEMAGVKNLVRFGLWKVPNNWEYRLYLDDDGVNNKLFKKLEGLAGKTFKDNEAMRSATFFNPKMDLW